MADKISVNYTVNWNSYNQKQISSQTLLLNDICYAKNDDYGRGGPSFKFYLGLNH